MCYTELTSRELISWEVDLVGVDLVGVDFVGVDLVGVNHREHGHLAETPWWSYRSKLQISLNREKVICYQLEFGK